MIESAEESDESFYTYQQVARETGYSLSYIYSAATGSHERIPDLSEYKDERYGRPGLLEPAVEILRKRAKNREER